MKSIIFYTSMIMMLFVSSQAFSEIIGIGDNQNIYNGHVSTEIAVNVEGSLHYDTISQSGWFYYYTDTAGTFSWNYTLTDCVAAFIMGLDPNESAAAIAYSSSAAYVSRQTNPIIACHSAYIEFRDENGTGSSPGSYPNPHGVGEDYFEAYNGVYIEAGGIVVAAIEEGSDARAYAMVYSWSGCNLW